ncbi:alpha/beta-hydrolase [Auriculariales sp. MPI-PUGE-AT-0066]|nr:alpha/beta-hydrolase [Auriculariales sp. MPI-PUGE-AT-0066]
MRPLHILATVCLSLGSVLAVDQALYDSLVYHYKYATTAYGPCSSCAHPNGQTFINSFSNAKTNTHGYIARDDKKQEFLVVFRGRMNANDNGTFNNKKLVPYVGSAGSHVHAGFYAAYNSVKDDIDKKLKLATANSKYQFWGLTTVGHDTGGSLAVIAMLHLRNVFLDMHRTTWTYGQPRTGDLSFAFLVDQALGFSVHRVTYKDDGVPKSIPLNINTGYVHHPIEDWVKHNNASSTVQCREYGDKVVGEDEKCSLSTKPTTWNAAHENYFSINYKTSFCKK